MENCAICTEPLTEDVVVTYCDHQFHRECITKWGNTQRDRGITSFCPMCRCKKVIFDEVRSIKEIRQRHMDTYILYNKLKNLTEELKIRYREECLNLSIECSFLEQSENKLKVEIERLKQENDMLRYRVQNECKMPNESGYSSDVPDKYQFKQDCCQGIVKNTGEQCGNKMKFGKYCGKHKNMFSANFVPTVMKSKLTGQYHVVLVDQVSGQYQYHCDVRV